MASITLDNVGLTFRVRRESRVPLKDLLVQRLKGNRQNNPVMTVHALSEISAHFGDGDRIGIIGHNGAGKSTFLKVLAGVYPPSAGRCEADGHISSLFDLTLGFTPHASGRDNIRYRGYLLGETPRSLDEKIDSIIDFAELGDFIDTPIRHYSSGMKVRLGFAIATSLNPEILLIDECFAAGDRAFKQKATERLEGMIDRARLIVMVAHDTKTLARLSNRVIWLNHGRIMRDGPAAEVIEEYSEYMKTTKDRGAGGRTSFKAA